MNVLLFGTRMDLISGHSRPAYELASQLASRGHAVRILSTGIPEERQRRHRGLRQQEAHLILPPTERILESGRDLLFPSRQQRKAIAAAAEWADVVHGFSFWTTNLLLARMPRRVPAVLTLNTLPRIAWRDLTSLGGLPEVVTIRRSALLGMLLPRAVIARSLRRFGKLISWTRFLRDAFLAMGVPPESVRTIRIGLDAQRLAAGPGRQQGAPALLYLGLLTPTRGAETTLRAFSRLLPRAPQATLVFADRGHHQASDERYVAAARRQLVRRIDELGPSSRVSVVGFQTEILTLIAAADVVVLPFAAAYGSSQPPLTVLEALAMGKPVVSTTVGSLPEIVDDEALGVLVQPADPAALADAIERAWRSDGEERRGARRRRMAEDYQWEAATDAILGEYEALLR